MWEVRSELAERHIEINWQHLMKKSILNGRHRLLTNFGRRNHSTGSVGAKRDLVLAVVFCLLFWWWDKECSLPTMFIKEKEIVQGTFPLTSFVWVQPTPYVDTTIALNHSTLRILTIPNQQENSFASKLLLRIKKGEPIPAHKQNSKECGTTGCCHLIKEDEPIPNLPHHSRPLLTAPLLLLG